MNIMECMVGNEKKIGLDRFVFLMFFVIVFGLKSPVLTVPYYWDEGVYFEPSYWLAQESLLRVVPGMHPADTFFGHPPLLYLLLAGLIRIFGAVSWAPHLIMVCFSFLCVYYTYLLGTHVYNRFAGIAGALVLFFMPIYFAQSGMTLGDIPAAALGVMSVYFFLKRNFPLYVMAGSCLVMAKETGAAIIVSILVYLCVTEWKQGGLIPKFLKYALPLALAMVFFIAQKVITGQFLPNPFFDNSPFAVFATTSIIFKSCYLIYWICIAQFRFILTALIAYAFLKFRKDVVKMELLLFAVIFVTFFVFFAVIFAMPRYLLPVLPYLSIVGAVAIHSVYNKSNRYLVTALCLVIFIYSSSGTGSGCKSYEMDMQYLDVVKVYQQTGRYLANNYSGSRIYAPWPLNTSYANPVMGYVDKPLLVSERPENADLLLYSPQSEQLDARRLQQIISANNLYPVKTFEKNGKSVAIYLLGNDGRKMIYETINSIPPKFESREVPGSENFRNILKFVFDLFG